MSFSSTEIQAEVMYASTEIQAERKLKHTQAHIAGRPDESSKALGRVLQCYTLEAKTKDKGVWDSRWMLADNVMLGRLFRMTARHGVTSQAKRRSANNHH